MHFLSYLKGVDVIWIDSSSKKIFPSHMILAKSIPFLIYHFNPFTRIFVLPPWKKTNRSCISHDQLSHQNQNLLLIVYSNFILSRSKILRKTSDIDLKSQK